MWLEWDLGMASRDVASLAPEDVASIAPGDVGSVAPGDVANEGRAQWNNMHSMVLFWEHCVVLQNSAALWITRL